jgi:aspartyl-tRNA(Asn)/glutamyl-tRNA(Gln) amidotransferase subunit C
MAKLNKKDVLHVAKLSNLTLTDEEVIKLTPQLSKIVDFVGQLSEVNTDGVEPTSQTTGLVNVLREDNVKSEELLSQDKALSNTNGYNGYFKVQGVLENRTNE